jgi:hypothetical protein
MYEPLTEEEKQRMKARRNVVAKGITYAALVVFFFILNMVTSPYSTWWIFPALGMGIGFVQHYVKVFVREDYSESRRDRKRRKRRDRWQGNTNRKKRQLPAADNYRDESLELPELEREPEPRYRNEDLV